MSIFKSVKNIYKKLKARFKSRTPAKWRRTGNIVLTVCTLTTVPVDVATRHVWISSLIFFAGLTARLLVQFMTEDANVQS